MADTHYIEALTKNGPNGTQRAQCGRLIDPVRHSTEPTCAECIKRLDSNPSFHCCHCGGFTTGRFTNRKTDSRHGWTQGHTHFVWFCFDCVPFGEGVCEELEQETAHVHA